MQYTHIRCTRCFELTKIDGSNEICTECRGKDMYDMKSQTEILKNKILKRDVEYNSLLYVNKENLEYFKTKIESTQLLKMKIKELELKNTSMEKEYEKLEKDYEELENAIKNVEFSKIKPRLENSSDDEEEEEQPKKQIKKKIPLNKNKSKVKKKK